MMGKNKASDDIGSEVSDLLKKKEFGAGLRQAREKLGMSTAEVAENLLISVDIIKALENSQADALPALTFTQGYIRSYSRLLGVSADEIIDDYVQMAPDSKQVLTPHSVLPAQKSSNDVFVKLISFGFVVIAVIVFAFWLNKTNFKIDSDLINDVTENNLQEVEESQHKESKQIPEVVEVASKPVITAPPQDVALLLEPKSVQAGQVSGAEINAIETSTDDQLFLSAQGESWCEIQDSSGKRLFYQLLSKGEEIKVSGVAPFTVFLGNGTNVRIEINNKLVDFENLINRNSNIASIQIGNDAAVSYIPNR